MPQGTQTGPGEGPEDPVAVMTGQEHATSGHLQQDVLVVKEGRPAHSVASKETGSEWAEVIELVVNLDAHPVVHPKMSDHELLPG